RRPELVRAHRNIGERVASQTGAVRDRADAAAGYQRPRGVTSVDARHLGLDQAVHHRSAVVERVGLFQRQVAGLARYAGLATSRRENHLPEPPYPDTHRAPTTDGGDGEADGGIGVDLPLTHLVPVAGELVLAGVLLVPLAVDEVPDGEV